MSEWTVDTAKAYLERMMEEADHRYEQRFNAQEKSVTAALTAAKDAVDKAQESAEKRFDSVNEFRAQLSDQATTFMPRSEAEQRISQNADRLEKMDRAAQECISRSEYNARHDDLVHQVSSLTSRVDRSSGQAMAESAGQLDYAQSQRNRQNLMMGWVLGAAVALIALVSLLVAIFR